MARRAPSSTQIIRAPSVPVKPRGRSFVRIAPSISKLEGRHVPFRFVTTEPQPGHGPGLGWGASAGMRVVRRLLHQDRGWRGGQIARAGPWPM